MHAKVWCWAKLSTGHLSLRGSTPLSPGHESEVVLTLFCFGFSNISLPDSCMFCLSYIGRRMFHIQPNHKKPPCDSIIWKADVIDFVDVMPLSQTQACGMFVLKTCAGKNLHSNHMWFYRDNPRLLLWTKTIGNIVWSPDLLLIQFSSGHPYLYVLYLGKDWLMSQFHLMDCCFVESSFLWKGNKLHFWCPIITKTLKELIAGIAVIKSQS